MSLDRVFLLMCFSNGNILGYSPSPPLVSIEPRFVEVQPGQGVEIRCTATGHPQPTIQWTSSRDGAVLNIVVFIKKYILIYFSQQVSTSDGVLKIASVRKSDEGEYVCTADNPSGTSTGRATIFVRTGFIIL